MKLNTAEVTREAPNENINALSHRPYDHAAQITAYGTENSYPFLDTPAVPVYFI